MALICYFVNTIYHTNGALTPAAGWSFIAPLREVDGLMKKKRSRAGMPLDEVFAKAGKDPRWKTAYARAGLEVKLAVQIAQARARAKLTRAELAKEIGTTQSVISRIETLSKIAEALRSNLVIQLR